MPRVNLGVDEMDRQIKGVIEKYIAVRGIKKSEVVKKIDRCRSEAYKGLKEPNEFKVRELRGIYNQLNVPKEERIGL